MERDKKEICSYLLQNSSKLEKSATEFDYSVN